MTNPTPAPDVASLPAKLRELAALRPANLKQHATVLREWTTEAADLIERQAALIAELEDGLRPFTYLLKEPRS